MNDMNKYEIEQGKEFPTEKSENVENVEEEGLRWTDEEPTDEDFRIEEDPLTKSDGTPKIVGKWSWAGFAIGPLWGLFNGVIWPFLVSLALVVVDFVFIFILIQNEEDFGWLYIANVAISLAISIYLGVKGNGLAWKKRKDGTTVEEFVKKQHSWAIAGLVVMAIEVVRVIYEVARADW